MRKIYTKEELEKAAKNSVSFRDLVIKLGLIPHGGSVGHYKQKVTSLGINTDHFLGQTWAFNKNNGFKKKTPEEILIDGYWAKGYMLKRALIESGIKEECKICGINEWCGKKLNLEVDHINGDKYNNEIHNLRFICPNCHSQTETYRFCGKKHKQEE